MKEEGSVAIIMTFCNTFQFTQHFHIFYYVYTSPKVLYYLHYYYFHCPKGKTEA